MPRLARHLRSESKIPHRKIEVKSRTTHFDAGYPQSESKTRPGTLSTATQDNRRFPPSARECFFYLFLLGVASFVLIRFDAMARIHEPKGQ